MAKIAHRRTRDSNDGIFLTRKDEPFANLYPQAHCAEHLLNDWHCSDRHPQFPFAFP